MALPFLELTAATAASDWDLSELAALHIEMKATMDAEVAMLVDLDEATTNA